MKLWRLGATFALLVSTVACCGEDEPQAQPSAAAAPERPFQPMPQSGYRVEWGTPRVPGSWKAGESLPVDLVVKNIGDQTWPDIPSSDQGKGRGAVRLTYRWWKSAGDKAPLVDYDLARGDLYAPVPPGGTADLTVMVVAPPKPGAYVLQLELVAELVQWFQDQGAAKLMVPVTVS